MEIRKLDLLNLKERLLASSLATADVRRHLAAFRPTSGTLTATQEAAIKAHDSNLSALELLNTIMACDVPLVAPGGIMGDRERARVQHPQDEGFA